MNAKACKMQKSLLTKRCAPVRMVAAAEKKGWTTMTTAATRRERTSSTLVHGQRVSLGSEHSVGHRRASLTNLGSKSRRGVSCSAGLVKKVTTQELEVAISSRDKPMVIDFFATWCGPCVMLAKVLEQLASELGEDVDFVKVDTDEEVELSSYFQIQGLPTLMFIGKDKGGKVLRAEGLLPAEQIRQMIEDVS